MRSHPSKAPSANWPKDDWGNSVLAINVKKWMCDYCGETIGNNEPFLIKPYPAKRHVEFSVKILCSAGCEKLEDIKYKAHNGD